MRRIQATTLLLLAALARNQASAAMLQEEAHATPSRVSAPAAPPRESVPATPSVSHRVIHAFDFNERPLGNLETVPMYWAPFRGKGFPFFADGSLDENVGHETAPSFRLSCSGRNVCFLYQGSQTRVRPNSTYRVAGCIKPEALLHARAMLAACFLNQSGEPILEGLARSEPIGGKGGGEWVEVSMDLPVAPPEARTIGLLVMILQRDSWDPAARRRGYVEFQDVHGGAWFDDIRVYALPRIELRCSAPTHVFTDGDTEGVDIRITSAEPSGLRYTAVVRDVEDRAVLEESADVELSAEGASRRLNLGALPPGIYRAELTVYEGEQPLTRRVLTCARVAAPRQGSRMSPARPFGIVIDPAKRCAPGLEADLLLSQGVRSAKLPVWSGLPDDDGNSEAGRREIDQAMMSLYRGGFRLTGVFAGPPPDVLKASGAYRPALLEILTSDPAAWSASVAEVVAPYATMIQAWQVGADDDLELASDVRLPDGRNKLRTEMKRFVHEPLMVTPASSALEPSVAPSEGGDLSLTLGRDVLPDQIEAHVEAFRKDGSLALDLFVCSADEDRYDRRARLADWAQRVILARHTGAQTVYVPQTWSVGRVDGIPVVEPKEEFVLLHTLTDVLGDAQPGSIVGIDETARAAVFIRGEEAVVALWDPAAGDGEREHELQLDGVREVVDLWGRRQELTTSADGRQRIRLTPMPVLIPGASMWVFEFQEKATLTPASLPFSVEPQSRTLSLSNSTSQAMSGEAELELPDAWEAKPSKLRFELPAQGTVTYPIELRYPSGEPAGSKLLRLSMTIEGTPPRVFEKEFTLDLGLADLDVWATAFTDRSSLVVRQTIRNRSSETLSFRGFVSAPGRARQYRLIAQIPPGASRIEEYSLPQAGALSGKLLRVGLRELDGTRIHNLELRAP
ncbi:MAG: hypothetical protein IT449_16025 [Phycisphaerales bacterium]|nr:hypothetical protein [Phycisphaerales bacterium]